MLRRPWYNSGHAWITQKAEKIPTWKDNEKVFYFPFQAQKLGNLKLINYI